MAMQCIIDSRENGIYSQYIDCFNNSEAFHATVTRSPNTPFDVIEFKFAYTNGYGRNMLRFLVCDTTTLKITTITATKSDYPDLFDDVTNMLSTTYTLDMNTIADLAQSNQLEVFVYPVGEFYQYGPPRFTVCMPPTPPAMY